MESGPEDKDGGGGYTAKYKHLAHFGILFVNNNAYSYFLSIALLSVSQDIILFISRYCDTVEHVYFFVQDVSPNIDPIPEGEAIALQVISYVGLIVSLLSLIVFLVSYLIVK